MSINKGTEMKLNKFENFNIAFGTMNKNKPKMVYIKISAWGNPIGNGNINYDRVIKNLAKRIKTTIYRDINTIKFNKDKSMVDLDMRESGVSYGKSSYMNCEITLQQNNHYLLSSDLMVSELSIITNNLLLNVFNNNEHFKFYKKKIDAKSNLIKPNHKD